MRKLLPLTVLAFPAVLMAQPAIERISQNTAGRNAEGRSSAPAVNRDGRFVAFYSDAPNLISPDLNDRRDVFVRDRQQNRVERIPSAPEPNGASQLGGFAPAISENGQFVSFSSNASNLVDGDSGQFEDVFLVDRYNGTIRRISVGTDGEAKGDSNFTDISADGCRVVFQSAAANLVERDENGATDIFVYDCTTEQIALVSVDSDGRQGNGPSITPAISGDGNFVAFASDADNLVEGDGNGLRDIFVRELGTGLTTRASVNSEGREADGVSFQPDLNFDGSVVAFKSEAIHLVANDSNGVPDVFVHILRGNGAGETERVSVDDFGNQSDGLSAFPSLSDDGRFVAFASFASQFDPQDGNGFSDIFVFDRRDKRIRRVSVELRDTGRPGGNVPDVPPSLSGDGRWIAFASGAENLVPDDENNQIDVFIACNPFEPTGCGQGFDTPTPTETPPGYCTSDDDCPPGQVCVDHQCVDATPTPTPPGYCTSDDDCPPGQVCVDHQCVTATPTPTSTATPTRTPIGYCTDDDDCPPGQVCVDNQCVTATPTRTPIGYCTDDDDCPPGQVCVDNTCVEATPIATPTHRRGGGGGCSCKIDADAPASGPEDALALLAPVALFWLRRRARRQSGGRPRCMLTAESV